MYCVLLTSDVIGSKKIKNLDSILQNKINDLNLKFEKDLLTKISSSRGDEIQFILKLNNSFFENIMTFRAVLYPIVVRTGASIVKITELNIGNLSNSWDLNGEPFFLARKILDEDLKKIKIYTLKFDSNIEKYDNIFNSFFILNDAILNNWKKIHWELIKIALEHNYDNKEISKKLGLYSEGSNKPTQTYYDRLKKTNISSIKESYNYIINEFQLKE